MALELKSYLKSQRAIVDAALDRLVFAPGMGDGVFAVHIKAMRYSLFAGGKRLRPILCLAGGGCVTADALCLEALLPVACALECIHTYSLIHDDLPAMDNDALRRGQPTSHVVFGEAGAILAGDGLLTLAFDLLSGTGPAVPDPAARLRIIQVIARAAGSLGMVGGQALDIASEGRSIDFSLLKTIHSTKTGALITASVVSGGIGGGAEEKQLQALERYGQQTGLAFQIIDDLLDIEGTTEELGKTAGSDVTHHKATYPLFFGVNESRKMARQAVEQAITALDCFNERAEPLRLLADYIVTRKT